MRRVRGSVYCTASFSVCSLRRAKFAIINPDLQLDYKVATHPPVTFEIQKRDPDFVKFRYERAEQYLTAKEESI